MQNKRKAALIVNTSVMFVIGTILEMTLHECGHFFAGLVYKAHPVLYHNSVRDTIDASALLQRMVIAGTGPVISLLIGVLFGAILRKKNQADITALFLLFMSVFGYIGFFGYIMVAPFFSYGDTGFVLHVLGCPLWLMILLAIASVGGLYLILKKMAPNFVSFMSKDTAENKGARNQFIVFMIVIPSIIGITATTLLNLPSPTFLSLLAPICSPFSIFWVYYDYVVAKPGNLGYSNDEIITQKISVVSVVFLFAIILMNRYLVNGVSF